MIFLGTTWRSARSCTALQVQTSVLRAGVDAVTVDESVAADEGYYAAGGMTSAADSVAAAQGNGADVDDSNAMLLLLLLLLLLAIAPVIPLLLFLLLAATPAGPELLLSNFPAGETAATSPLTTISPAATLPKTTNGKRMGVARRRRRRHLRFLRLLHSAVGIRCANGILYECTCDVGRREGRAFVDIVIIRQLADNYLNNFPLRFLDADNPHGVDELIYSCQEAFWVFVREHMYEWSLAVPQAVPPKHHITSRKIPSLNNFPHLGNTAASNQFFFDFCVARRLQQVSPRFSVFSHELLNMDRNKKVMVLTANHVDRVSGICGCDCVLQTFAA